MRLIKAILAAVAIAAQFVAFVGFAYMLFDIVVLPDVLFPGQSATAAELTPYVLDTIVSYWAFIAVGALGALVTWLLILQGQYLARWFLTAAHILGWLWMPLLPIGTILGTAILTSRSRAKLEQSTSP